MSRYSRYKEAKFYVGPSEVVMESTYNPVFIDLFKAMVLPDKRRWNNDRRVWVFAPEYLPEVIRLAKSCDYDVSQQGTMAVEGEAQGGRMSVQVNYLGNVRRRRDGSLTASGMSERGEWLYIFPWSVIAGWLDIGVTPLDVANLYDRLSVAPNAEATEIKRAFRSMVRVWHPDVSPHAQATDVFRAIQEAYDVLSDDRQRRKYDVALRLQSQMSAPVESEVTWVPPDYLRCGWYDIEADAVMGRYVVTQVYGHDDIINSAGKIMVSQWDTTQNMPVYNWR